MDPAAIPFLGIDFGTSKSCMARFNPSTGQVEVLRNAEGEEKTPSVVYFGDSETLVGSPAEALVGDESEQGRVFVSVKRNLVSATMMSIDTGRRVRPVEIAAEILRKLKRDAESLYYQVTISHAVITCPASFDSFQRTKIADAAKLAGFAEVALIEEPVAAAIAYARAGLPIGDHILIYDLGGGTFDVAILSKDEEGRFHLAMPPVGIQHRGGDDLDRVIYDHCDEIARQTLGLSLSVDGRVNQRLLQECRACKELLSFRERCALHFVLDSDSPKVDFRYVMERSVFNELIGPDHIEPTIRLTDEVLQKARAIGKPVDTVLLIGGSSRIPLVQQRILEIASMTARKWGNQDVAVAMGAAYHAIELWNETPVRVLGTGNTDMELVGSVSESQFVALVTRPPDLSDTTVTSANFTRVNYLNGHSHSVTFLAFSSNGQLLVSADHMGVINCWDFGNRSVLFSIASRPLSALALSPDGTLLIAPDSGHFNVWNLVSRTMTRQISLPRWTRVNSIAFSRDGQHIGCGCEDKKVFVFDAGSGKLLRTLTNHSKAVRTVLFSHDGQYVLSAGDDKNVIISDVGGGVVRKILAGPSKAVGSMALSPDGRYIVAGGKDKRIYIWDSRNWTLSRVIQGLKGEVATLGFDSSGKYLASVANDDDHEILLWDYLQAAIVNVLKSSGGGHRAKTLVFDPTGRCLVVGGDYEGRIEVWSKVDGNSKGAIVSLEKSTNKAFSIV